MRFKVCLVNYTEQYITTDPRHTYLHVVVSAI